MVLAPVGIAVPSIMGGAMHGLLAIGDSFEKIEAAPVRGDLKIVSQCDVLIGELIFRRSMNKKCS
jgi:hypothetical protein